MLSTHTLEKFPKITYDIVLKAMREFERDHPRVSNTLKCSPEAYIAIKDYFLDKEMEELMERLNNNKLVLAGEERKPVDTWGSLFGIEIILDPDLKAGEWKFV